MDTWTLEYRQLRSSVPRGLHFSRWAVSGQKSQVPFSLKLYAAQTFLRCENDFPQTSGLNFRV